MNSWFFFGPERIPFRLLNDGMVELDSTMPFHGIISRGILNRFISDNIDIQLWYKYAYHLGRKTNTENSLPFDFMQIQKTADSCGFLDFGQSALCVKSYAEKYSRSKNQKEAHIDCWNIKEGQTSSVWKVTINAKNNAETFILNVARDIDAGSELKESSIKLKTIGDQIPDINIARVFDIRVINDEMLPGEVVVTRNEWIENACEIHSRTKREGGKEELLMVERFLTSENNPAQIVSVFGRVFSTEEIQKIETDLNKFLTQATTCLTYTPEISINDGDVVWNGEKAIVVALS